jgi:hypothetical protein
MSRESQQDESEIHFALTAKELYVLRTRLNAQPAKGYTQYDILTRLGRIGIRIIGWPLYPRDSLRLTCQFMDFLMASCLRLIMNFDRLNCLGRAASKWPSEAGLISTVSSG